MKYLYKGFIIFLIFGIVVSINNFISHSVSYIDYFNTLLIITFGVLIYTKSSQ